MNAQLPLALGGWRQLSFDNFWAVQDALLIKRLQLIAQFPASLRILMTGSPDSGKTHLLLASCERAREHGHSVLFLPLARIGADELRDAHLADLIAVDDAHLATTDADLAHALFATINRQHDRQAAVLIAARTGPEDSPGMLRDLSSRLAQAERLRIAQHDDDARKQILLLRASDAGMPLDSAAADYLLRHSDRDLRSLMAQLARLDREALARGRRITVPLLRELLTVRND